MHEKLGLLKEDEKEREAREEACKRGDPAPQPNEYVDELVCAYQLPDENYALCDWRNPIMELESRYKDMTTFQLAMRQFAIKKEFDLAIEASTLVKYRGYCKGGKCPWIIHARVEEKGSLTVVV
jgi:hypothetical protein